MFVDGPNLSPRLHAHLVGVEGGFVDLPPLVGASRNRLPEGLELAAWNVYVGLMSALLDKAISAIQKLPEAEQETIAREVLERIEADARWEKLFADPRSKDALKRLAAEAQADIERGVSAPPPLPG